MDNFGEVHMHYIELV